MALTPIEEVRLYIGATSSSPFFSLLSDEEIEFFIDKNSDNTYLAAKQAAIAMSLQISAIPTREYTGEIEVWNETIKYYLKALEKFLSTSPSTYLQKGITPWAAGISWDDVIANTTNPDKVKSMLSQFTYNESLMDRCDYENLI